MRNQYLIVTTQKFRISDRTVYHWSKSTRSKLLFELWNASCSLNLRWKQSCYQDKKKNLIESLSIKKRYAQSMMQLHKADHKSDFFKKTKKTYNKESMSVFCSV